MEERKGILYLITNTVNDKKYVGQTTQTLERRWNQHIDDSISERSNMIIHRAIRKYGVNHFSIVELEKVPLSELDEREIDWIEYYDSFNSGYNMTIGGSGSRRITTEEANTILEMWNSGWAMNDIFIETNRALSTIRNILEQKGITKKQRLAHYFDTIARAVVQIDFETRKIVGIFSSPVEARDLYGFSTYSIRGCCADTSFSAGGYFWRYKDTLSLLELESMKYLGKLPETYDYRPQEDRKIDYDKALALYNLGYSAEDIGCELGCSRSALTHILTAMKVTTEDRRLRMASCPKREIVQITFDGVVVNIFESAEQAAKYLGVDPSSLCKACKKIAMAYDHYWKYSTEIEIVEIEGVRKVKDWINLRKPFGVICQLDARQNILRQFSTKVEAAIWVGRNGPNITVAIQKGTTCGGFYWKDTNNMTELELLYKEENYDYRTIIWQKLKQKTEDELQILAQQAGIFDKANLINAIMLYCLKEWELKHSA